MMHPWPVRGPTRLAVTTVAGILAAVAAVGCATDAAVSEVVSRSIEEPWQAEPFDIDAAVADRAEVACQRLRIQMRQGPVQAPLAVVDARGGSKILFVYASPTAEGDCIAELGPSGEWIASGGSAPLGGVFPALAPGAVKIESQTVTGDGPGAGSVVVGRAGAGVATVAVRWVGGKPVRASLGPAGWFAAWYPGSSTDAIVSAYDAAGNVIGTAP